MIVEVTVRGFKRFRDERFPFAQLSVLTGLNGSGKTSLIQAILVARIASQAAGTSLPLNGTFDLELGGAEDVRNWGAREIEILAKSNCLGDLNWRFTIPSDDALYLNIVERPEMVPAAFSAEPRAFTYLSAERLGPRTASAMSPLPDDNIEVGTRGENSAHLLSTLGNKVIAQSARTHPLHTPSTPRLLKYEIEQWLSEITRPVEINGDRLLGSTFAELRFRPPGGEWVRAPNTGFGLSYALPIVLGGLIAKEGGMIIVENPEAHLHPGGQSRMGIFLAWLAGKGVQVVIETHSDHVLNGIRRAIAEYHYLEAERAVALFFGPDNADPGVATPHTLTFTEDGSVSHWPKGFFDQYQIDVSSLGRLRRRR